MPVIAESSFKAKKIFNNGHLQSILPALFRKVKPVKFNRERLELVDGDFIDLDWFCKENKKLVILCHGLEGSSKTKYMHGMANAFSAKNYDVLSWNARGCSGEPNRLLRFYHCGNSADLQTVIDYAIKHRNYTKVVLIGFSMGGNIILKYLGESAENIAEEIKAAVVFSTPCHLKDSAIELQKKSRKIYLNRFLKSLKNKIIDKNKLMPGKLNISELNKIKTFFQFDELFTAPLHGFKNADHYYESSSSVYYLSNITKPVLIVNALNDPFLGGRCFPYKEASESNFVFLETPKSGGHVGFMENNFSQKIYWSEKRALEFIDNVVSK